MKKDQRKYRFLVYFEDEPKEAYPLYAGSLDGIKAMRKEFRKMSSPRIIFGPIEIARWEIVKGKAERGTKQEEEKDVH